MAEQAEVERCIDCFRIRELVTCLDTLGLKRTGKKADMHSRLLEFYRLNKDGEGLDLPPGEVYEKYRDLGALSDHLLNL